MLVNFQHDLLQIISEISFLAFLQILVGLLFLRFSVHFDYSCSSSQKNDDKFAENGGAQLNGSENRSKIDSIEIFNFKTSHLLLFRQFSNFQSSDIQIHRLHFQFDIDWIVILSGSTAKIDSWQLVAWAWWLSACWSVLLIEPSILRLENRWPFFVDFESFWCVALIIHENFLRLANCDENTPW